MPEPADDRARLERQFISEQQRRRRRDVLTQIALNGTGIAVFLAVWEILPRSIPGLNTALFPPPTGILDALAQLVWSGELLADMAASLVRVLAGFGLGALFGIALGLITARVMSVRYLCDPILQGFRSIPAIAVVPLAIVWFGIGEVSKISLITWGTFFPIWINTHLGARDASPVLIRSAQSLGANRLTVLLWVILPAALPLILAGLRQALAIAFIVMVAAELVGAAVGLGQLIATAQQTFHIDYMFVGLLALGALGFACDRIFVAIVTRLFPWYGRS